MTGKSAESEHRLTGLEIAVIGMAGRFPGARNIDEFWDNLKNGRESVTFFSDEELAEAGVESDVITDPHYVKAKPILEDKDYFDAFFFGYSPAEAEVMAPHVRIFHECAWAALEDAGYDPIAYQGLIGCYVGSSSGFLWKALSLLSGKHQHLGYWASHLLNEKDNLGTHLSYKLNLTGPSFTFFSACSTSLVAVHLASRALLTGECSMALAGGIALDTSGKPGYLFQEGMIHSPDGHCRAFDANANGAVFGEGVGAVLLKRYKDAVKDGDYIYALVKGSAVNNDGISKVGYTAPGTQGQRDVVKLAHKAAKVMTESITYVETHGTGTTLGDPMEITALSNAFNTDKKQFCALGSVKTNIGHLDTAAGIAGFIKAVLALKHHLIPPSLHFETPNPKIDFKNSPFYINTKPREWNHEQGPLRAGVSSFGIGGTNAHAVLEAWSTEHGAWSEKGREYQLVLLSAKTETALEKMTQNLAHYFNKNPVHPVNPENPVLPDIAYTLQMGRRGFQHRRMVVCSTAAEAAQTLSNPDDNKVRTFFTQEENQESPVVFMLPGLGSEYPDMGRELYEKEPLFHEEMDRCFKILQPLMDYDIKEILYPSLMLNRSDRSYKTNITQSEIAQPVIFTIEYALAKMLMTWGIKPDAIIGYSFGEYAAACISGVFSLEDALKLVVARGKLIQKSPPGVMLSVPLPREEVFPLLDSYRELALAIDNGPSCIAAGPEETVAAFEKELREKKIMCMRVPVSRALHSPMMAAIAKEFQEVVGSLTLNTPQIPYVSNVSGNWVRADQAADPGYWSTHLQQTVRFADGIKLLVNRWKNALFVEVGPGRDLSALVVRYIQKDPEHRIIHLLRHPQRKISDLYFLLDKIGRLWLYGKRPDWHGFYAGEKRQRIPLPTYPFDRHYYPAQGDPFALGMEMLSRPSLLDRLDKKADIADWFYLPSWKRSLMPSPNIMQPLEQACWLLFGDPGGLGSQLAEHLQNQKQEVIMVRQGNAFSNIDHLQYTINPRQPEDYHNLLSQLKKHGNIPGKMIHLWSVTGKSKEQDKKSGAEVFDSTQDLGLYSLVYLAQAIGSLDHSSDFEITVISDCIHEVTGEENLCPEKSTVLAPIKVIPQEYPYIICRSIDIVRPAPGTRQEKHMINRLAKELFRPIDSSDTVVAYRGNSRWVQTYEPVRLEEIPADTAVPGLKQGGVYLVTGGLGGLGLTLAEYLAQTVRAKLVLISRSPLPAREAWDEWLANPEKNQPTSDKIRKIKAFEKAGAEVLVFSADVANREEMERVFTLSEEQFGPVNGVIHAAGILGGGGTSFNMISKLNKAAFKEQFQAKVYGLFVLEEILRSRPLDFCLLTSSLSPILGGLGFTAYSAANQFMDAFVYRHNRENLNRWLSLNWGDWQPWNETDQQPKIGATISQLNMLPEQGIETFRRILFFCDANQVVVSSGDLQVRIDQWVKLKTLREEDKPVSEKAFSVYRRSHLSDSYVSPQNQLEHTLAEIWQRLFGFDQIGIRDDFFELGGDSLKAITLGARIHKELNVEIPLTEFFQRTTIEALAQYIDEHAVGITEAYAPIEAVETREYYPLSSAQKRLYVLQQMQKEFTGYNDQMAFVIEGEFEEEKLEKAFKKLIQRHESLRTSFEMVNNEPVQRIHDEVEAGIEVYDSPSLFIRPFNLSHPPLLRVGLVKWEEQKHLLMFDMHHIVFDGTSMGILVDETAKFYAGEDLPPLKIQYKDFSTWQNRLFERGEIKEQEDYWLNLYSNVGEISRLNLPLDYPRPQVMDFEGDSYEFKLGREHTLELKALAAHFDATLYMNLLAILNVLLFKYTGQEDIIVGSAIVGRPYVELQPIIGMFVNTLALRHRPYGEKTYLEFLKEVKTASIKAYENQDLPFEDLVDKLNLARDPSRNPLFDICLAFQNFEQPRVRLEGVSAAPYRLKNKTSRFDMTIFTWEVGDEIAFGLEYYTSIFKPETIRRFTHHLLNLIKEVCREPRTRLADIDILTEDEKHRLLYVFNDTASGYPENKTLHQLFEEQAGRTGDKIALIGENNRSVTYGELNQKARQWAGVLREKGVNSDGIVGMLTERSIEMIIGILGILKAGGAYLPIDPDYPEDRINYMLADSGAKVLLKSEIRNSKSETNSNAQNINDQNKNPGTAFVLNFENLNFDIVSNFEFRASNLSSSNLAYIIYTSGTTGKPKGVMIENRNVVQLLFNHDFLFDFGSDDVWTLFHSYNFDFSVWEMYGALLYGGKLRIIPKMAARDTETFLQILRDEQVTVLNQTPSSFYRLVDEEMAHRDRDLNIRYVIFGGEALTPIKLKPWREKYPATRLINMFGITETTVHVTYKEISEHEINSNISNIGKPLPLLAAYVMDNSRKLVPLGVPGELCVGGAGIGRGYLNRPALTGMRIIKNPYHPRDRMYLSGDLVKLSVEGEMEYLGRIDHQVKIRGYRVELGEIQNRLLDHPAVKQAVVIDREDKNRDKYLAAYVVPQAGPAVMVSELRDYLSQLLPDYMVPSYFVPLDRVPLTANGKLDRKALPEPEVQTGKDHIAPSNQIEETLTAIWSEVLAIGKEKISMNADFFELGGHSLKATILAARIHKAFEVKIPLADIFKWPTIRGLSQTIIKTSKDSYTAIPVAEKKEYYILSSAQKRLYILQQMEPDNTVYNMPQVVPLEVLDKRLDKDRLEGTFKKLIQRHESLRTSFLVINEEPVQKIHKDVAWSMEHGARDRNSSFVRPFDLSQAPLLRVGLIKVEKERYVLMVDMHHIITDGFSQEILVREFMAIYRGTSLAPLRLRYKDYAEWQNLETRKGFLNQQEQYWWDRLAGELPVLNLPYDYPRPQVQSFEGRHKDFSIGSKETAGLNAVAAAQEVTIYMMLMALFNLLLSRLSGQEDIIIGSPVAGRSHADCQQIIGMFVNTLVMRNYPSGDKTFISFLREIKDSALKAFENQEYQFEDLVEKATVVRDPGRNPVFDVVFAFQNLLEQREIIDAVDEFPSYDFETGISKFDLTLFAAQTGEYMSFSVEYCTRLLKEETIERFISYFKNIISSILKNPEQEISDIEILAEEERQQVLVDFNNTEVAYPDDKTVRQLFEQQVEQIPDQIALVDLVGRHLTYRTYMTYKELNRKSNQLAGVLREKGVTSDGIVGIMVDRSSEMIIGVLGILKAGGAYLPVDPDYPEERKKYMLKEANAQLLITEEAYAQQMEGETTAEIITIGNPEIFKGPANNPAMVNTSDDSIYIIYTSGSTGTPKGVVVMHRNVVRLVKNTNFVQFREGERLLQTGALEFDASTFEIWGSLLNGMILCLVPKDDILNPGKLKEHIRTYDIATIWLTSPLFNQLSGVDVEIFAGLKNLLVGGDVLSPLHINRVRERYPALNIINGYGPTENTTFSTTFLIHREYNQRIPIGSPISNSTAYVVDRHDRLVPVGVTGELLVGGDGVSRGYLNNPELTTEKFHLIKSFLGGPGGRFYKKAPLAAGGTIYKTGDLVRWLSDGTIDFLGRMDQQVKIRGFRIELEEIESCLLKHELIKEAVVIDRKEENGEKYLCGYIVLEGESKVSELKEYLSRHLPDYMIPSYFVQMDHIPLTPNGKVDRRALPMPEVGVGETYAAPTNETEVQLALLWSEVLNIEKDKIGVDTDFFELGGHSLKATILTAKIHKAFNVKVPLTDIFLMPTIRELAQYIKDSVEEKHIAIPVVEEKEYYRLSPAQKRLYILQQMESESIGYNMPYVVSLDIAVDKEKLEKTFKQLIHRHESLRTSFIVVHEEPVQRIHKDVVFELESHVAWSMEHGAWDRNSVHAPCSMPHASFVRPFDLSQAPLLRVGLIKLAEEKYIFMMDMHHIITDGISQGIFLKEFMAFYTNGDVSLPSLRLQYKDYAEWQNHDRQLESLMQQEQYWIGRFAGELPVINLPYDYQRPVVQSFEGHHKTFFTNKKETAALRALAVGEDVTLYMGLLAVFTLLLARLSGQEDIIIGSPAAGRRHADLQPIMGMFVNTLAMRIHPAGAKTVSSFLQEVKQSSLEAFENQEYPFETLVEKVSTDRDVGRNPVFDVMFALQNLSEENQREESPNGDGNLLPYDYESGISKFDLTLDAVEGHDNIFFSFEYCSKLFKEDTIQRFIGYFNEILASILQDPTQRISDIEIISEAEKQRLLIEFNDTEAPYPTDKTIWQLFEDQVEQTPDNIALVGSFGQPLTYRTYITYKTLNKKANQLARILRDKGVLPDSIIALMVHRSVEMIFAILGVLKSGAAYLPIDPQYPELRVEYMLSDSRSEWLLVKVDGFKNTTFRGNILHLDKIANVEKASSNLERINTVQDLAYVIYTSGSTGQPKGVMVDHRNIAAYVDAFLREFELTPNHTILQQASYTFDAFGEEVFPVLSTGGKIVIAEKFTIIDMDLLTRFIKDHHINIVDCSPLLLNQLNKTPALPGDINIFISGGDVLKDEYVSNLYKHGNVYNTYGPTETTVCATFYRYRCPVPGKSNVPIGQPAANYKCYTLDKNNRPVPVGVPGELCISGDGVTRGYLNRVELTHEKFITNPFEKDRKLYKSGDLARLSVDGEIEFLGRIDHQVKIRGFRIELGEIENQLVKHPTVKEAVVLAPLDYLCAYIVTAAEMDPSQLRDHLSKRLPGYMMPTYFMQIEKIPLTPNGKVDLKALPKPEAQKGEEYIAPSNETEEKLTALWSEVLAVPKDKISTGANFFELGGHSLKGTVLAAKIHKAFDVKMPLIEIFTTPTIKGLSQYIIGAVKDKYTSIEAVEEREYYALSSAQKRLYLLRQMEKQGTAYNMPLVMKVEGDIRLEKLQNAFTKLIQRHESLRTSFMMVNQEPVQKIHKDAAFAIDYIPGEAGIQTIINHFVRPFDLSQAPLLRCGLIKIDKETHMLMIDMHHIISDGVSFEVMVEDFAAFYHGKELPPLKLRYRDYSQWQNSEAWRKRIKNQEEWWLNEFAGEVPLLNLPLDFHRPAIQSFEGDALTFQINEKETEALKSLASGQNLTLFMVLLGIYTVLLSKLGSQEEIVVGSPIAGRPHADLENIIGVFVNTLALRSDVLGEKPFSVFLKDLKERTLKAFENQEYQFEDLVDQVSVKRDASRNPLFDTVFTLQEVAGPGFQTTDLAITPYDSEYNIAKFDLLLDAVDSQGLLFFTFGYSTKLFKKTTIQRFINYFKAIISALLQDPQQKIAGMEIISLEEKHQLLFDFNDTAKDYPADRTIHWLFEHQAAKTPANIAVVSTTGKDREYLSYKKLKEQSDRLVGYLCQRGVRENQLVGIMVKRSVEMIVGILGILKTGCAYVPLNPKAPAARSKFILEECGARYLVSEGSEVGEVGRNIEVIDLTKIMGPIGPIGPILHGLPTHLCYVIFTSGSTGKPKGVPITHANLSPLLHWGYKELGIGTKDRFIQNLSYYFDWSVWEIVMALTTGASLYMVPDQLLLNPGACISFMNEKGITVLHITPSQYHYFVNAGRKLETLKYLFLGAEKLSIDLLKRSLESVNADCRVFNMYGPTECTIIAAVMEVHRPGGETFPNISSIPIGGPAANSDLLVLDKYLNLCPVNVLGELYIGGDCVAHGYLNNPELTIEKFFSSSLLSFSASQLLRSPLYRTGDLVRWLLDGPPEGGAPMIEFFGRIDQQVKIRGFRIELGEIESQLVKHRLIREAVVIDREKENGETYLCGYIVSTEPFEPSELKEYLSKTVPDYMVPSYFISIDNIPLTPNGKLDRKALPEPEEQAAGAYVAPSNEIEEKLAAVWSEVLDIEKNKISIDADFFQLGGHSLKATLLTAEIHKIFDVKIQLVEIFRLPTVRELAKYIEASAVERYTGITAVEEKEYYILSSAQKRLYILQQMDTQGVGYNMPYVMPLAMPVDKEKLEAIFKQMIHRHQSLRTSFMVVNEEPVQKIHQEVVFKIEYDELVQRGELQEAIDHFVRPFDLSQAPLQRVKLIKLADEEYILLMDMHHIITDGISQGIFVKEFMSLYEGVSLPPLRLQYKDYAEWQQRDAYRQLLTRQEQYWLERFAGQLPVLDLPYDYHRPEIQSFAGIDKSFSIGKEETMAINTLAAREQVTLYMVLLTAFNLLLARLSGLEDIIIGSPVAGRRHADLQQIIGMFVNTLAMRNSPAGDKTVQSFLREVKESTLEAFENQDYPFEDLVEKVSVVRDARRNPVFDVVFAFQNLWDHQEPAARIVEYEYESRIAKFDMTLFAVETGDGLAFTWEYCTRLFKEQTIEQFINYFKNIVSSIVESHHQKICDVEMLREEEKRRILLDFNDTGEPYHNDKTIPQLFEAQVEQTPDNIALIGSVGTRFIASETIAMTYKQLNQISNQLAYYLHEHGVGENSLVGLMANRSIQMIIGILGILKAGGAYVPLNPKAPVSRSKFILAECGARFLVSGVSEVSEVDRNVEVIDLTKITGSIGSIRPIGPIDHGLPNRLCYVIFTSGSTGRPKGVPITHANLCPLLHWGYRELELGTKDRFIQNLSYYFDWSVWEIVMAITTGAGLYMVPDELLLNPEACVDFMNQNAITVLHVTPTQYQYFVNIGRKLETLKYLFIGAEKLSRELVEQSFESVNEDCRVFNMYGPTECTIISAVLEIERSHVETFENLSSVPIGSPVANSNLLVLDKYLNPCPENVLGELYIGGDCVAHGYLNNPEFTIEKFFSSSLLSFSASQLLRSPLYRTGDLVRWLPNAPPAGGPSIIEFLGRIDQQVKIRGFRIELGEIESRLLPHELVKEAVVIDREKEDGEKYLCAYIIPKEDFDLTELKEYLSGHLPDYMIPSYFMQIESIPLNPNGKLDRRALPVPDVRVGEEYTPPSDVIEEKLVVVWSEVLGIEKEKIGVDANFFELGGHSLSATVLMSKINREFKSGVPLVQIFSTPTIRELAGYLRETCADVSLEDRQVVRLKKGINRRHLFLIHDGSGEVEGYVELCRRLQGAIDCWGLRAAQAEGDARYAPLNLSIQEIARSYIVKIKQIQPHGPYHIAGWSLGGTIAFEIALQLEQIGEGVAFFALIDTMPPQGGGTTEFTLQSESQWLSEFLADDAIAGLAGKAENLATFWQSVVSGLEDKNIDVDRIRRQVPEHVSRVIPHFDRLTLKELIYYYNVNRTLTRAYDRYIPEGKVKTLIHFFAAGKANIEKEKEWQEYSSSPLKMIEINADHFSILKEPQVTSLCRYIDETVSIRLFQ